MTLTARLVATVAIVCLGSLQFGYHMAELNSPGAVMSCERSAPGRVPYAESFFGRHGFSECIPLGAEQIGMATSIFSIGGLGGSFCAGAAADRFGRKRTAVAQNGFFFVGSLVATGANSYGALLAGRFLAGIGAGSALVVTSLVINEIAPAAAKGLLGSMNQVAVNVGILLTQVLALWWCTNNDWRYVLLTGCVLAAANAALLLAHVDESPVWLHNNGCSTRAFTVLHHLRGGEYAAARSEVSGWAGDEEDGLLGGGAAAVRGVSVREYLTRPEYARSRLVSTGILVFQQFCGINSIVFYGVSVLTSLFPSAAVAINCLVSVVNAVVTFVSAPLVDRLGRKPLLGASVAMMGVSAAMLGFGINTANAWLSVAGTFVYITFFALGLGPIPFLLVGEVTQPQAKASAQSWGVTMNWLATFVVGYLFPILKSSRLGAGVYYIFSLMCALSYVFIQRCIPETKGCNSYEEVWR